MVNPPARPVRAGEQLVQHLVEDDELHEEPRHRRVVQRRVNADLPGLVVIDAEADRLPPPSAGRAPPPDARPHAALEEALVERVADLLQMEEAALGRESLVRGVAFLTDARLLALDELVQDSPGLRPTAACVIGHCLDHRDRRIQEHVMQPQPECRGSAAEADHRAPVVGDGQSNRHPQVPGEMLGQRGGPLDRDLARRDTHPGTRLGIEEQKLTRRRIAHGLTERTLPQPGAARAWGSVTFRRLSDEARSARLD